MKKTKLIGAIIVSTIFILMIAGSTYAWFNWKSDNANISSKSNCFVINYGISQEIGFSDASHFLTMGEDYTSGLFSTVSLSINPNCTGIKGVGTIYLNTNVIGTDDDILTEGLKYTVVRKTGSNSEILTSGTITSTEKIKLLEDINITTNTYTYEVWVWIDSNIFDNNYNKANYSGYISAEVNEAN